MTLEHELDRIWQEIAKKSVKKALKWRFSGLFEGGLVQLVYSPMQGTFFFKGPEPRKISFPTLSSLLRVVRP